MMSMRGSRAAPILWCLAAAALFGASTPVAKSLLGGLSPLALAGLLYLGAAAGVLPVALHGGSREARCGRRNRLYLLGAVVAGGGLGPVLLLAGLSLAPAASVALWLNLETVATVVLARLFFREHLGARTAIAAAVILLAGILLSSPSGFGSLGAAGLVAAACLCWGIDNNLTSLVDGYTPAQTTLAKGVVAGGVNLALAFAVEGPPSGLPTIGAALVVGAAGYGFSIALYVRGAQHLGAVRSQIVFSSSPFLGVAVAWILFGEAVLPVQLVAAAAMIGAVGLVSSARHEHEHVHEVLTHTHSHRHDDLHHDHAHEATSPDARHTHEHRHAEQVHSHPHDPDLTHRHAHE